MTRPPRIVGTFSRGRTLFVLPEIDDDAPTEVKDGLAIRNACSVRGICPDCGATGEITTGQHDDGFHHITFLHEDWCRVLRDGEGAA